LHLVPASALPKELGGELPTLQNVYPAPDDSAILDWMARVKGADFWPPRNATSEKPSELAEPPTPQEASEPAAGVAEAALKIGKPAPCACECGADGEPAPASAKQVPIAPDVAEASDHAPPAKCCCSMQ